MKNESHDLWTVCRGQQCSDNLRIVDLSRLVCLKLDKAQAFIYMLDEQQERKEK